MSLLPPRWSRGEALKLYRDILRTCRLFTWKTDKGEVWGKVLAASARVEYEQAREENDPEVLARLLIAGRHCLDQAQNQLAAKHNKFVEDVNASRTPEPPRSRRRDD